MANFDPIITDALKKEGGYSNVTTDQGGETYRGIARKFNPSWSGWAFIDAKKKIAPIKRYTIFPELESSVKSYYRANYWNKINGDQIKDQEVAHILFDAYINQTGAFGWMVRGALNKTKNSKAYDISDKPQLHLPFTSAIIADTNSQNAEKFFNNFKAEREEYYKARAQVGSNSANLSGWLSRLSSFDYVDFAKKNPSIAVIALILTIGVILLSYYLLFNPKIPVVS